MSRENLKRKVAEYVRELEETPWNEVSNASSEVFSQSGYSETRIFKSTDEAMNHVLLYQPYTSLRKADGHVELKAVRDLVRHTDWIKLLTFKTNGKYAVGFSTVTSRRIVPVVQGDPVKALPCRRPHVQHAKSEQPYARARAYF